MSLLLSNQHTGIMCLAGFLTLYAFNNPLKGKSIRVCQVLILPPFQRQGHGQRLLREAYRLAREKDVVYEVNRLQRRLRLELVRRLIVTLSL